MWRWWLVWIVKRFQVPHFVTVVSGWGCWGGGMLHPTIEGVHLHHDIVARIAMPPFYEAKHIALCVKLPTAIK